MNYKQLQALIYVARHGTFKKAAEALYFESPGEEYVTPESIQYRIKQLEADVGVTLYRKRQGSSSVLLTREGQLFLREAVEVYQRMSEWRGMFLETAGGVVAFASTQAVLIHRIHDAVLEFRKRFPQVMIRAMNAPAETMERWVAEGAIDFAISTRRPDIPDLEYVPWRRSRMVMICAENHPLAQRDTVSLADIAPHQMVALDPDVRGDRDLMDEAFARAGFRQLNIVLETSNSEIIASYVEAGIGVSVIAETSQIRQARRVKSIPISDFPRKSETGLLVREGQYMPARVTGLISLLDPMFEDWLASRASQHPEEPENGATPKSKGKKKVT